MAELWLNMVICLKKKGQSTVITGIGMSRHGSYSNGERVQSWDLVLRIHVLLLPGVLPLNLTTQTWFDLWTQTIHHEQIWSKVSISPGSPDFSPRFATSHFASPFLGSHRWSKHDQTRRPRGTRPGVAMAPSTGGPRRAPRLQRRANLWHLLLEDLYLSTLTAIV